MIIKGLAIAAAAVFASAAASAAVTVINFDNGTAPGFSGDFTVFPRAGSSGNAATVNGTPFLAVPSENSASGTATYTAAGAITSFSFDWGTPDSYNTLTFRDGNGNAIASYTGSGPSFTGTYTFASGTNIRTVDFSSTSKAFEIDNVSVTAAVPEPATWALMLAGFGFVGFAARRRATAVSA